jgi:hypothetical protein
LAREVRARDDEGTARRAAYTGRGPRMVRAGRLRSISICARASRRFDGVGCGWRADGDRAGRDIMATGARVAAEYLTGNG